MTDDIEVNALVKTFGRTRALDGLDLRVCRGEVHGFLGPNGAGKTTAIRILLGLFHADGGTVRLLGGDPWRDRVALHRRLAYVPGDVTLWSNLSGGETIDLLGRLRGGIDGGRKAELLERFDLDPRKKGRAYSKGNRQKVALVAALASDARLLILDEPTSGLDPLMEETFRQVLRERLDAGCTVLLSSHILSEVEALCDRVSIIRAGRTVESGTLAQLRHLTRTSIYAVLTEPVDVDGVAAMTGVHAIQVEGRRIECQVDNTALSEVMRHLSVLGIEELVSRPPDVGGVVSAPLWAVHQQLGQRPRGRPRRRCCVVYREPVRPVSSLTGTATLLRLALRRDRVRLPLWIAGLATLLTVQAAGNAEIYDTTEDRTAVATVLAANPALRLLRGPAADTSIGALVMSDAYWLLAVLAALMSALAVIRHTRQDEEAGRTELVGATPVGAHASLTAALMTAASANVGLFVLLTGGLLLTGLPVAGSAAAGASIAATGLCFAALAAVAAQLSSSTRTTTAVTVAAIGTAYLLRAAGDATGELHSSGTTATSGWPSWLSPIGWGQQIHPFAGERWWVLGLPAAFIAVCTALALRLSTRRDFGLGLIPARTGPADAPRTLSSPLGLAARLHRGTLLGWVGGVAVASALFGSLGQQLDELASNADLIETLARVGGSADALSDTYFAAIMALVSAVIAGYPLQILLRMRAEEADGRLEPVLAAAVDRRAWIGGHILWAAAGTVVLLLVAGIAAGVGDAVTSDQNQMGPLAVAALVQAPAVLTLAGLVIAAFAVVPRHTGPIAWTILTVALVLGPVGEIFNLPETARDLSPMTHVPALPAEDLTATPIVVLLAVAALLGAVGTAAFNRRNIALDG